MTAADVATPLHEPASVKGSVLPFPTVVILEAGAALRDTK
jgi:hypothetical protein